MNGGVLAFSGGIGGAKLALGLSRVLESGALTVIANTGDDFEHLGLSISPDIDTLLYTLAGIDNPDTGWGCRDETWNFMAALERLDGETWFKLGDRDLATHVERTRRLHAGEPLSRITDDFARRLGVPARIVPMSDEPVRTCVRTPDGWLEFQHYFVRLQCTPKVLELRFAGAESAQPVRAWIDALADPSLRAVVICPSNPFISIDPILAVPGVRDALRACRAPRIAVSPIIAGKAVKGPTAKMMEELGMPVTAAAVAAHYDGLIDGYLMDEADAGSTPDEPRVRHAATLMRTLADRERLARDVLAFADELRTSRR